MLNDNATFIINEGHYYVAPVGTALPTDLSKISEPWVELGHTDIESPLTISSEGGDVSTLGTLENKKLRTVRTPAIRTLEVTIQQFDADTLKYYLGANAHEEGGLLYEQDSVAPVTGALLCVVRDGENYLAIHMRKFEASANGDFEAEDSENFTGFPVKFTALNEPGKTGSLGISQVVDKSFKPVAKPAAAAGPRG